MNGSIYAKAVVLLFLSSLMISSCKQVKENNTVYFNLKTIAERNPGLSEIQKSETFGQDVLIINPAENNASLTVWESGDKGNWADANYFTFEVWNAEDYSVVISIDFYRKTADDKTETLTVKGGELSSKPKDTPWQSTDIGVLPGLKTKVVFPLSYLDVQKLFIPRSPRQLKGTMEGSRLDPNDISKVVLRFAPVMDPLFNPVFEIASVSVSDSLPEPYPPCSPFIDKFGQRMNKDWPGKIEDDDDLINRIRELEKEIANCEPNPEWGKFGGWKAKRFKATGFFRTQHDGKRWWLVDPEGYAFLSVGVDHTMLGSAGPVNGIEDFFEWLPGEDETPYNSALTTSTRWGVNQKTMDFYKTNLMRVYGQDYRKGWSALTAGLMKMYNINTIGNWSDLDFAREYKIPYVLPLGRFPSTEIQLYRDFPDVFSDEYRKNAEEFAAQLTGYKDDPYLVGYFLRNEPQWAFGDNNLAFEMFGTPQESYTKKEFIKWISEQYNGDVSVFNEAWTVNIENFESLLTLVMKEYPSDKSAKDLYEFSKIMVKRYIDIPCDEVEKIDKNHLNLGMRYAWMSSDLLYIAGERFDVFSINGYGLVPPATGEIAKKSGKPVMIGEFHHGAVDMNLPATGLVGVLNQEERGKAYRNYVEQGFARPEIVGLHYFEWIDQPFYGRFDGENYNIGLVTITNIPYQELAEAMKITNGRIYKVGSGLEAPYKGDIKRIHPIHY